MTSKEYLSQIKKLNQLINIKQKEIDKLRLMTGYKAVRYDLERVDGGQPTDRMDLICEIIDYERELKRDIDAFINLKKEILKVIEKLSDDKYIKLLYMRYFEFKTWEEISVTLDCSYRWIIKLHGKALSEMEEILK